MTRHRLFKPLLLFLPLLLACQPEGKESSEITPTVQEESYEKINTLVNEYLKKNYLWNEEYRTLKPDFSLKYDDFLETTLTSMKTNVLDHKKKETGEGQVVSSLFSYIIQIDPALKANSGGTTRATIEAKQLEFNYGLVSLQPVGYRNSDKVGFIVLGVHPESSVHKAGLKRGDEITQVNHVTLNINNYRSHLIELLMPESAQSTTVNTHDGKNHDLSSAPIAPNPILYSQVVQRNKGNIGYLVYSHFEAGFDQELFDKFKTFKRAGVTDLILDLRYNAGGHVSSANLIASCIAGTACQGKVFSIYEYNKKRNKTIPESARTERFAYNSYYNLNRQSLNEGALNLKRLYCLTTSQTASASELLINALRGIDVEVILIGTTTKGKNVGMETTELNDGKNDYKLYPVTFYTLNAKRESDYSDGFLPTYTQSESVSAIYDFGTTNEPFLNRALNLIDGNTRLENLNASTRSRSASSSGQALEPPIFRSSGMILTPSSRF